MRCTRPVLERCKTGPIEIIERPCGVCPACRASKAQEWTYRIYAESKLHTKLAFVTLTYDDEYIKRLRLSPTGIYSLDKKELQDFNKRLRKNISRRIRFYAVGEYGDRTRRPHYHGIYFGVSPADRPIIEACWKFGFVSVDSVTPASIAYVARYCVKKLKDSGIDYAFEQIEPEFALKSLKPGIGFNAIEKGVRRSKDGSMFCWYQGKRVAVPAYFKKKLRDSFDWYIARLRADSERESRIADFERSGRCQEDEWLQSERNRKARTSVRCKI